VKARATERDMAMATRVVSNNEGVNIGLVESPFQHTMSLTLARLCGEWRLVSGANYSSYE
jgi:hypothetical protein